MTDYVLRNLSEASASLILEALEAYEEEMEGTDKEQLIADVWDEFLDGVWVQ